MAVEVEAECARPGVDEAARDGRRTESDRDELRGGRYSWSDLRLK